MLKEEINKVLEIDKKALDRLLKTGPNKQDKYNREDVIRACMGGKIII